MDTEPAAKSVVANRREGIMLTALQAVPALSGAVLALKLAGSSAIVGQPAGPVIFVLLVSLTVASFTAWLGPKYPGRYRNYEPAFFDPSLSIKEKVQRWLDNPRTSRQLLQMVCILTPLAIMVSSA
jgi:hypothetical protein